jgi:hypothetical protein
LYGVDNMPSAFRPRGDHGRCSLRFGTLCYQLNLIQSYFSTLLPSKLQNCLGKCCYWNAQDEADHQKMDQISRAPRLVASTSDTYCCSIATSKVRESKLQDVRLGEEEVNLPAEIRDEEFESNYFKSAQWYDLTHFIVKPSNRFPGRQMEPLSLLQTKTTQSEPSFSLQRSSNHPLQ